MQPLGQENSDNRILEIDRVTQELALKGNTWWMYLIQMFNVWVYAITSVIKLTHENLKEPWYF